MYSMVSPLRELETSLLFDALEGSFRNIFFEERHRDPTRLYGMLELLMATCLRNLKPAVLLEPADDFPAIHRGAPFRLENTHFVYTQQVSALPSWRAYD